ncbi:hypothetical protein P879_08250 [Paragonimus westermani]|uniref:Uncharacterized protein n=1 Tax=Paragonimus westermani TaxID=34504 RepID=A0A8T0DUS9_9TREM|nr:hypothetical protein P879_08250 [Paragonimus westermani]
MWHIARPTGPSVVSAHPQVVLPGSSLVSPVGCKAVPLPPEQRTRASMAPINSRSTSSGVAENKQRDKELEELLWVSVVLVNLLLFLTAVPTPTRTAYELGSWDNFFGNEKSIPPSGLRKDLEELVTFNNQSPFSAVPCKQCAPAVRWWRDQSQFLSQELNRMLSLNAKQWARCENLSRENRLLKLELCCANGSAPRSAQAPHQHSPIRTHLTRTFDC